MWRRGEQHQVAPDHHYTLSQKVTCCVLTPRGPPHRRFSLEAQHHHHLLGQQSSGSISLMFPSGGEEIPLVADLRVTNGLGVRIFRF